MDFPLTALIFVGGIVAGVLNTVAGGGSLITLPLLIFSGLPANVANGTNRLAIVLQNVTAVGTFHHRGVKVARESAWLLVPSVLGAVVGANLAITLDERILRFIIGIILVVMLVPILRSGPRKTADRDRQLRLRPWMWPAYFALGVYGGFIQAGVGFFFLALLVGVSGLNLVRANAIKVFLILGYTLVALILFISHGQFSLAPALALAAGNATGGWLGAHLAVSKGEGWIRWILVAMVLASALKLTGIAGMVGRWLG